MAEFGREADSRTLVAGAIVLWNTAYLEAAMQHLERQGWPVSADVLVHLSPLGWQHMASSRDCRAIRGAVADKVMSSPVRRD